MTIEQLYEIYLRHPSIQTDTRKLTNGDLFFALKGPNFNGNKFAVRALEMGAAYAVIDEAPSDEEMPPPYHSDRLLFFPDVLKALQDLALHHRKQFTIPFIAITGSNGKTTTKELVSTVLASTYKTYTTVGNLNNHIGVPLTILSVQKDAEFAVIEMGANHQKEIEGYCQYTLPTHGIITNAGKAHLEGFGGPEGVKKGKGELYDFLRANNGTAFVMWDYDYLRTMSKGIPQILTYGTKDAEIVGNVDHSDPSFLTVTLSDGTKIHTQLVGDYNLPNVLVAVTVGIHFGVPAEKIIGSIEGYSPSNSRSQLIERDGNAIILDAYNANPSSMRAAIENFARIPDARPKLLILGAMAELGPESLAEHQAITELIGQYKWQDVVLVGGDFQKLEHPYKRFANSEEAKTWFKAVGIKGSYILIKGSRSSKMEEVLN